MLDFIARVWGSAEVLDQITRWSTIMTFVAPLCFGIFALVTDHRAKYLQESQHKTQIANLESANQKLVSDLGLTEQQLKSLKEQQEPWRLLANDANKLRHELGSVPKGKVRVEYIQSDERRARPCAEQLCDLLKASGYDVWGYMGPFTRVNAPTLIGIDMSYKVQNTRPVAAGLQTAFKAIGLNTPISVRNPQDATYGDDQIVIYIGLKP
jgi:hypothetical protein